MKKAVWIAVFVVLAGAVAIVALRNVSEETVAAQAEVSEATAKVLQSKIDAVKAAEAREDRAPLTVDISEEELEAYVLYSLREEIPVRIDSIDVKLTAGAVAADLSMTSGPNGTGNPVVDVLFGGTHSVFVKGKLSATASKGRFELEGVNVDGIPVPFVLIETLIAKYVKPKYPAVDLKEPFMMPWGIEDLVITERKATVGY